MAYDNTIRHYEVSIGDLEKEEQDEDIYDDIAPASITSKPSIQPMDIKESGRKTGMRKLHV